MGTATGADQKRVVVQILTPEGPVHDGVATIVIAPSVDGEIGILPRHAPIIAALQVGDTRLTQVDGSTLIFATSDGYMAVEEDRVLILVESAENAADIDRADAQAAFDAAQQALADAGDDEAKRIAAESALRRAENRLRVADV
jgi:F-type H+-transporting ATPase subunit epsilon